MAITNVNKKRAIRQHYLEKSIYYLLGKRPRHAGFDQRLTTIPPAFFLLRLKNIFFVTCV